MLDRPAASWAGAALTLALASSCAEPPSYAVRWKLVDQAGEVSELSSVKQCADVGLSTIRVTTKRGEVIIDRREYPCFPGAFERGEAVEVPALPPGEYEVEIEGLRRTGEPWVCEAEPCVAFATDTVTISEGELPTVEVELLQPPECDDGIDNDRDGRVDGSDPACILDPSGVESAETAFTLFQLTVSFLGSAAVFPADVSVDALRLEVDGEQADGTPIVDELLAEIPAFELDTTQWPFRLPLLAHDYEPGSYVLSVVAVDQQGTAVTSAHELPFEVPLEQFVLEQIDFGGDRFLEPIVEPIAATLGLLLDPADEVGPPCELGGFVAGAPVTIERMWLRVTDENQQPLDAATLALTGTAAGSPVMPIMPVDELDGWVSLACPSSMVVSAPLSWGSYDLEVEARIGDVACFTSEGPRDLAPLGQSGAQEFYLTRVVDDQGAPPAGCEECSVDADCSGQVCEAGICKDKQP